MIFDGQGGWTTWRDDAAALGWHGWKGSLNEQFDQSPRAGSANDCPTSIKNLDGITQKSLALSSAETVTLTRSRGYRAFITTTTANILTLVKTKTVSKLLQFFHGTSATLTRTNLGSFNSAGDPFGTATFTTSSFTPPDNSLLIVQIYVNNNSGHVPGSTFTMSGGGLTWNKLTAASEDGIFFDSALTYYATVTTGASMTLALDAGADNIWEYAAYVVAYTNYDTVSPFGATGHTGGGSNPTNFSVTLNTNPALTSEVLAFANIDGGIQLDPGVGFSEIQNAAQTYLCQQVRSNSTSTSVPFSDVASAAEYAACAVEIKQAPLSQGVVQSIINTATRVKTLLIGTNPGTLTRLDLGHFDSGNAIGAGTFTTSSFTPSNNSLLVVGVAVEGTNASDIEAVFTLSGGGLTWTKQTSAQDTSDPAGTDFTVIYTAPVTTGASMTIAVDSGAITVYRYNVDVVCYTNYNAASPVGGKGSGHSATGSDPFTFNLDASPELASEVVAIGLVDSATINPGAGWLTIYSDTPDVQVKMISRANSTSPTVTWANFTSSVGVSTCGVEVKQTPRSLIQYITEVFVSGGGGGSTTQKALTFANAMALSLIKQVGKRINQTLTNTLTIIRQIGKIVATPLANTLTKIAQVGKIIGFTSANALSLIKQAGKRLTMTSANALSLLKSTGKIIATPLANVLTKVIQVGKIVATPIANTLSLIKQVGKRITMTLANTLFFTGIKVFLKALTFSNANTLTLIKQVGKIVSSTLANTLSLIRQISKTISLTSANALTIVKQVGKRILFSLNNTLFATAVRGTVSRIILMSSANTLSLLKSVNHIITMASANALSLLKSVGKIIITTTAVALLFNRLKVFLRSATATLGNTLTLIKTTTFNRIITTATALAVSFVNQIRKIIAIPLTNALTLVKSIGKIFTMTSSVILLFNRLKVFLKSATAQLSNTLTLRKSVGKIVASTLSNALTYIVQVGKRLSMTSPESLTAIKSVGKILRTFTTNTLTRVRQVGKIIGLASTNSLSMVRRLAITLTMGLGNTLSAFPRKVVKKTLLFSHAVRQFFDKRIGGVEFGQIINTFTSSTVTVGKALVQVVTNTLTSVLSYFGPKPILPENVSAAVRNAGDAIVAAARDTSSSILTAAGTAFNAGITATARASSNTISFVTRMFDRVSAKKR